MMAVDNQGAAVPMTAGTGIMRRSVPPAPVASVERSSPDFPAPLLRLSRPPARLWYVGRLPGASTRAVALVGARAASGAGCERAIAMAGALGRRGLAIVSGGAFGIDAAAHEGALSA